MKSKLTILLAILVAAALILSACGGHVTSEPPAPVEPAEPGTTEEPQASPEAPSEPAVVRIGYAGSPDIDYRNIDLLDVTGTSGNDVLDTMLNSGSDLDQKRWAEHQMGEAAQVWESEAAAQDVVPDEVWLEIYAQFQSVA